MFGDEEDEDEGPVALLGVGVVSDVAGVPPREGALRAMIFKFLKTAITVASQEYLQSIGDNER